MCRIFLSFIIVSSFSYFILFFWIFTLAWHEVVFYDTKLRTWLEWSEWKLVQAEPLWPAPSRSAREDCATDQDFYLNFSIVSVKMSARLGQGCGALGSGQGRRDIVTTRAKVSLSSHVGCCQQCALCTLPWHDLDFLGQLCCRGRLARWTVGALAGNLCSHSTPGLGPECPD